MFLCIYMLICLKNKGCYGIMIWVIIMFSVIFDMDGTLFDTQKIFIPAWEYAGKKYGFENMGAHIPAVCGVNPKGCDDYLRKTFPTLDIDSFKAVVRTYVEENMVVKFKEGAEELLSFLKQNGVKIALATGTSRPSTEHHLKEVNLSDFFDATVCGNEIENGKPNPDIFLRAAQLLNANPEDCFVFEDSVNGIKAGYNAGMKCIGVPDVVTFSDEDRKMMFAELESLDKAIPILQNLL